MNCSFVVYCNCNCKYSYRVYIYIYTYSMYTGGKEFENGQDNTESDKKFPLAL
jgi:hypothetical protein